MAVIRTELTCKDATATSAARPLDRPRNCVRRVLAALAASVVALLFLPGSASAASFSADPGSLGPIPDGPASCYGFDTGMDRDVTFTVTGVSSPITNVAVSMTLDPAHTWVGDLQVKLIAPGFSTDDPIFWRTGASLATDPGYSSDAAGPYTFSDTAPASPTWWEAASAAMIAPIPSGSYRASSAGGEGAGGGANILLTPHFTNVNPNGLWILSFFDNCQGNTGSVAAATLDVTGTSPPAAPVTTPSSTSTSTGQRAAALKKCKKKKKKKKKTSRARKKCQKKANLLPV